MFTFEKFELSIYDNFSTHNQVITAPRSEHYSVGRGAGGRARDPAGAVLRRFPRSERERFHTNRIISFRQDTLQLHLQAPGGDSAGAQLPSRGILYPSANQSTVF